MEPRTVSLWGMTIGIIISGLGAVVPAAIADDAALSPKERLGKRLFFDKALSVNKTLSCAGCHDATTGYTGPTSEINMVGAVMPGAVPDRFGNRKPPSAAYAGDSPALHYDEATKTWFGGMFWDGRATGANLNDALAEQAMGPFLNPLEQNMPSPKQVCIRVAHSEYAELFESVWGAGSLDFVKDVNGTYRRIVQSIAAYERSAEMNPYTSKFDLFYKNAKAAGKDIKNITTMGIGMNGGMGGGGKITSARWQYYQGLGLSDDELKGLAVFNDASRMGGNCASCHSLKEGPSGYPLFTDFSYHNLGIPKNPNNPFYTMDKEWNPDGAAWVDYGLGGFFKKYGLKPAVYTPELGKFKTPTLRNVDLRPYPGFVKAYGHNGYFKSLEGMDGIVHFYAWRAMMDNGCMGDMGGGGMGGGNCMGMGNMNGMTPNPSQFPAPEVDQNRITMKPFNFMMFGDDLIAFLKTLSDGYQPQ